MARTHLHRPSQADETERMLLGSKSGFVTYLTAMKTKTMIQYYFIFLAPVAAFTIGISLYKKVNYYLIRLLNFIYRFHHYRSLFSLWMKN